MPIPAALITAGKVALPIIGSILGGISGGGKGKKKRAGSEVIYWPGQKEAYTKGLGASQYALTPEYMKGLAAPYGGQLSAGMSDLEGQQIDFLKNWRPGQLSELSSQQLIDTLSGKYNPYDSPYYAAMREGIGRETERGVTAASQAANIGGMLSSTGRMGTEGELRGKGANLINQIMGQAFEGERGRMLGAVPQALAMENMPLDRAISLLSAGAVPRQVEQQDLDRQYQEFIRQMVAMGIPIEIAMKLIGMGAVGTEGKESTGASWSLKGVGDLMGTMAATKTKTGKWF